MSHEEYNALCEEHCYLEAQLEDSRRLCEEELWRLSMELNRAYDDFWREQSRILDRLDELEARLA